MPTTETSAARVALTDLEDHGAFARRHIGTDEAERAALLAVVGAADLDAFLDRVVPASIRTATPLPLPGGRTESETLDAARRLGARNEVYTSLIGMGYHGTIVPPVLQRNILENPAWYTAYTPYQPEISQGRLEALLNFQTMVADLAGLDVANASLLDEGTAAAEAMTLAQRASKHPGHAFFVDAHCHPQTIAVLRTRAEPIGIEVVVGDPGVDFDGARCFGAIVQYPSTFGSVRDLRPIAATIHDAGALLAVAADPLALVLLEAPGHQGADIVVGSTQRFGVPMGFGGPHAAYLATRETFARSLPGRLVGVSTDSAGRPALRLALQTREQHIRREKATSNICTAQVLLAVMAGMYAVWHGPDGLRRIAERVHRLTAVMAAALEGGGVQRVNETWFDTLTLRVAHSAVVAERARQQCINVRVIDSMTVSVTLDETTTVAVVARLLSAFGVTTTADALYALDSTAADGIPREARRHDEILSHPVFHRYHAEHEMLRYLRRLADRDLALDRTMIPLGSCTM
jgi:glycine dehydrogenase